MTLSALCRSFASDESGLEAVEYAIMVGLIIGGAIAVLGAIGSWVLTQYESLPA
jgi:Flp pilus assembly pilin Flp